MSNTQKQPKGYADLTLTQLKTFADRGDLRAKHELDLRLGGSKLATSPAPSPPPLPSVPVPPHSKATGNAEEYVPARVLAARAQAAATPFAQTKPDPLSPYSPSGFASLGNADRMNQRSGSLNETLLYENLPQGQNLSPDLLARLQDIANRAPEPEVQPPLILGSSMVLIGVVMLLFGFSVTRGETGTWYFVGCGAALLASGVLYLQGKAIAWLVYGATCLLALAWAASASNSWLEAVLNLMPFIGLSAFAFSPSTRERLS